MNNSRHASPLDPDSTLRDTSYVDADADPLELFGSESELAQPVGQQSPPFAAPLAPPPPAPAAHVGKSGGVEATAKAETEVPAPSPTRAEHTLALDQVMDRLGSLSWTEAVAVVEALCEALNSRGATRMPEMSRVSITARGTVETSGGSVSGPAAALLARALHVLTAGAAMPAPLRLFITKWISAGEEQSVAAFAKDLSYFSRPGGNDLIRVVYERAIAAAPAAPVSTKPSSSAEGSVKPKPKVTVARRVPPVYLAAAAVILFCVIIGALVARRGSSLPPTAQATEADVQTLGTETLAGGSNYVTALEPKASAGTSPRPLPGGINLQTRAGGPSARAPVSAAVQRSQSTPAAALTSDQAAADRRLGNVQGNGRDAAADSEPARSEVNEPGVYSSANRDVSPPRLLQQQLPAQFLNVPHPDMITIELIVSETGAVERVRLLSTPKRMADMMMLSGAKSWEFEPALKDGQAVPYRLELSWAATP